MIDRRWCAALVIAVAVGGCTDGAEAPEAAPTFTPDAPPPEPTRLLYLDERELRSFDLESQASEVVNELPSADAALSPDGGLVVVVEESHPEGPGPEGFREPVLTIAGTSAQETPSELGPGRSPTWSATGSMVAAIAPTARGETIVVYRIPGGPQETAARRDELWSLVGWRNDEVVAIGTRSGVVAVPSDGGELRAFRLDPNELWGVAPSGDAFLSVGAARPTIVHSDERVDLEDDIALGDGAWSWDGATIAAVAIGRRARTDLTLIDAITGNVIRVPGGRGAQGNVVWAEDGSTYAFVRVKPDQRARLEAMICSIANGCDPAFSWDQGVTLLGFASN